MLSENMKNLKIEHTFLILCFVFEIKCASIQFKNTTETKIIEKDIHLKIEHIKKVCLNRVAICKSNDSVVCAARLKNGKIEYLEFNNSCFLFLNNMCEHYESEYAIVFSGACSSYINSRRVNPTQTTSVNKKGVREGKIPDKLYEVDTAFDFHTCPLSCPDVYSPVCVNVNRGHGLYLKFFTFANHCQGDLYYCKNWREFEPPPGEDELVSASQLSWSMCAANRYIQFARFTEMTSSMGHYGWLAGDHRPTHIIEPHERLPGYG